MEMRHETPGTGHVFYDFIRQQIRLDRGYAVTLNAFHIVQRFHQVEESLTGRFAEVSYIDTGQYYFLSTFGSCPAGLLHHRSNAAVTATSAGKGNGAIGTIIIATVLHFQEETGTVATRTRRGKRTYILQSRSIGLAGLVLLQITQVLEQVFLLLSSQHHVHTFYLCHRVRFQLGIATGHHDKRARMLLHQLVDDLAALLVRHFCHRAGIHYANIRFLTLARRTHTRFPQNSTDSRGLREVQFAPQRIVNRRLILKYIGIYHELINTFMLQRYTLLIYFPYFCTLN